MSVLHLASLLLLAGAPALDDAEELRPGLLAVYRSHVEPKATLTRVEPKPAFYLGHSSPHPRLPCGPFEVTWSGILQLKEPGPLTFDAFLGGELAMEVDGVVVLKGQGQTDTAHLGAKATLDRKPGLYRVTITYRSLPSVPARLQIGWEGPTFAREPLPAWRLLHVPAGLPLSAQREELAARGRAAVGKYGCARCHSAAFPGVTDPPPGPALADVGQRVSRNWLLHWLDDPAKVRDDAHMPALFTADRQGFLERWLVAEYLTAGQEQKPSTPQRDHRAGRLTFLGLGCATCHFVPDLPRAEQADLERTALTGLGDRFQPDDLAAFLGNPHGRYPDGRMPRLPVAPDAARDMAAFLLLWAKPTSDLPAATPPSGEEINAAVRRLGAGNRKDAVATLLRERGCIRCHTGLGATTPEAVPIKDATRGCITGKSGTRFALDEPTRQAIAAFQAVAGREVQPSPFFARQQQLSHAGCVRCHQRDSDRPPPIEETGSTLGGAFHQYLPFQRTPRLTNAHQKYTRAHLLQAVREGVTGLRPGRYTYKMPAFGGDAESLVLALAEADGELPSAPDPVLRPAADPTAPTVHGPSLVGFQGYACVSCHLWNGQTLSESDPGAVGPDLTRTAGRIRRDWFERFLEDPARSHPFTPMPSIFRRGQRAILDTVLEGDAARQKDALWDYFAVGSKAPGPKALPPVPVPVPAAEAAPLVAQIPIHLPNGGVIESICVLNGKHDLLVYDLGVNAPHSVYTAGQILRSVQGRIRKFHATGTPLGKGLLADPQIRLIRNEKAESPTTRTLRGYDRLADGVRIRWAASFGSDVVEIEETLQLKGRALHRELRFTGIPSGDRLELRGQSPDTAPLEVKASTAGLAVISMTWPLPPARTPPPFEGKVLVDSGIAEGSLERPGYRAIAYPRPKTIAGEDRVMPGAVAVSPRDGCVFVASLKTGELFALRDPDGTGQHATFENYGGGLFADALAMDADADALYVLHRRNLTRIPHPTSADGPQRFDRAAALPHGVADTYDYAYGLARDKTGAFVLSYAPYANATQPGAGGAVRLVPGKPPEEIAFGMRNPLGWCAGPEGEIFFTDNQGEWVAANKLCHVAPGRYYGFPNNAQKQHMTKPAGKTAVWVPYGWARSINGVTYDNSSGKFGPFAGQFFLAELMFGGAIVRAQVEKVNGEYQGACFPFWGKGLLGPVTLAFDPQGRLFVGGITEPGWMAMPDRGALFRIDFTGTTPFEMRSIHVLPHGYRIMFTKPVDPKTAREIASYQIERYRYEYTGAYGSPELDRTRVPVERVELAADGLSVEVTTALMKDRVYLIAAAGVRSASGETLVHPTGAYTLNEIPEKR